MAVPYRIPRAWEGETVVCLASGPSLTREDVEHVRGKARVIAVNDTFRLAPWADVIYAADSAWWAHPDKHDARKCEGLKLTCTDGVAGDWIHSLKHNGRTGFEDDPTTIRTGSNSGYQAVHIAAHFGAARVLLLGYDMKPGPPGRSHFFGDHPPPLRVTSPYKSFIEAFDTLAPELAARFVTIINCSRDTALTAFPRSTIEREI